MRVALDFDVDDYYQGIDQWDTVNFGSGAVSIAGSESFDKLYTANSKGIFSARSISDD